MRLVAAAFIFLTMSGAGLAQTTPATGATQRDGSQPTGTILQPERRLQPDLQPPPQNPQPFGAPVGGNAGGPVQETGNYGNLGLGAKTPGSGEANQRSLVQPDYRRPNGESPFDKR